MCAWWPSSPKIVAAADCGQQAVADHVPFVVISTIFLFLLPSSSPVLPIKQDSSCLDSSPARLDINTKELPLLRKGKYSALLNSAATKVSQSIRPKKTRPSADIHRFELL
jgi:hypothetical protein